MENVTKEELYEGTTKIGDNFHKLDRLFNFWGKKPKRKCKALFKEEANAPPNTNYIPSCNRIESANAIGANNDNTSSGNNIMASYNDAGLLGIPANICAVSSACNTHVYKSQTPIPDF